METSSRHEDVPQRQTNGIYISSALCRNHILKRNLFLEKSKNFVNAFSFNPYGPVIQKLQANYSGRSGGWKYPHQGL